MLLNKGSIFKHIDFASHITRKACLELHSRVQELKF